MHRLPFSIVFGLSAFLSAQVPQLSNQEGEVQRVEESGRAGKSAKLPGLGFYDEVIRRIQNGNDSNAWEVSFTKPAKSLMPAVNWYIQVHVAPSFSEDTLFTLRELTNDVGEIVLILPRGGINLWYQLSTPCMTEKPMTVEQAVKRLAYNRFQLTEKEFPAIRKMINEFKATKAPFFFSNPNQISLDGTSYSFKGKATEWSFDVSTSNPDEDNPLVQWAESCSKTIWEFIRKDTTYGLPAHPITSIDNQCIGQAILKTQAGAGVAEDVRQLIKLGVPVDSKDYWDEGTPLQVAAENYQLEVVMLLLNAGAIASTVRWDGRSAMHLLPDQYALDYPTNMQDVQEWIKERLLRASCRVQIADALRKAGAPVDLGDQDGITPLMEAANRKDSLLVAWLIRNGADSTKKDKAGKSARDRATASGNKALLDALTRSK